MFGGPTRSTLTPMGPVGDRSVPLDIGPFHDQSELLRFAMLLEATPGLGHIDLIDAEPLNALFVIRAPSAAAVATAVARVPDFRIVAHVAGNGVTARVEEETTRAIAVLARPQRSVLVGGTAAYLYRSQRWSRWIVRAGIVAGTTAAAAALLFVALTMRPGEPDAVSVRSPQPTPAAGVVPTSTVPRASVTAAPTIPQPTSTPTTPAASPTVAPPTPTATASPTPTATPSPTPPALVARTYRGTFSGSLGSVTAVNGCRWDTPFTADFDMRLTRSSDGTLRGPATVLAKISYVVTNIPSGATCNATVVSTDAVGSASGSGDQVSASLTGARDLSVTFSGTYSERALTGNVTLKRSLSTVSTFGNTSEVRSASISGFTLTRTN